MGHFPLSQYSSIPMVVGSKEKLNKDILNIAKINNWPVHIFDEF